MEYVARADALAGEWTVLRLFGDENERAAELAGELHRAAFWLAVAVFVVSTAARQYSQVDKLWSIVPMALTWLVAFRTGFADTRVLLMTAAATVWGVRLTYNFHLRGGYSWKFWEGEEDYRWAYVKAWPVFQIPFVWSLFNLTFISFFQMYLLMFLALPAVAVAATPGEAGAAHYALAGLFVLLVALEAAADAQQQAFQNEKHRRMKAQGAASAVHLKGAGDEAYRRGFIVSGLWAWSRHPNYTCEQTLWLVFYAFAPAVGGAATWPALGAVFLLILFNSSADLSEGISAGKYPDYPLYQKTVSRFWPTPFGKAFPTKTD